MSIVNKIKICFIPCEENHYRPKFLAGGTLFHVVLGLLILKIIAVGFFAYFPKTAFFADLTKVALIQMTNEERQTSGVGILKENSQLDTAAMQKAQDMFANDYFAHQSPQGISPWYWFKFAGYNYKIAGENLAIGFIDSQEVVNAWINSPSHKENLLNPKFQETGMAVLTGDFQGAKTTVVVQLFGTATNSSVTKANTTTVSAQTKNTTNTTEEKPSQTVAQNGIKTNSQEETENEEVSSTVASSESQTLTGNNLVSVKGETTFLSQNSNKENKGFFNKFLQFMVFHYSDILQKIIFYTLLIITIALLLNIFVKIKKQDTKLILKTGVFIILLILFVFSDKEVILQLIPHDLLI